MNATLASIVLLPALAWVVVSDLLYRRISNTLVLALLLSWAAYAAWVLAQGDAGQRSALLTGALASIAVLAVGYFLFTMRWMGAGDAKLMAVLCLWLGDHTFVFLIVTALAGGVLALALPLLRMLERTLALGLVRLNTWLSTLVFPTPHALRPEQTQGIPYGLAIASGAAFVLWSAS
ncbi:Type IV prepilin peptidase TadV/CpaA [plant metagenome]|uniref:Type IV prepilin peptidase TadV/CpaA n=2 Tax=root TaxID=1 RepID=A0A1C3JXH1_9BURK|nr:prepilin peptidase [Orrella dioscoreae]SBT23982.1 Type IV prepilin peptidase TadV/CpaA [Orrella dioscoreae]SOE47331.1 Type IV prepilin peptidase TadV/CpaA [Orrella dioscoreae]